MPNKTTPQNEHLNPFEYDFCEFARNVEFENIKNELQIKLRSELKTSRSSNNFYVFADNTNRTVIFKVGLSTSKKLGFIVLFASMKGLENDEKCSLFHVKSSVRSQDN